MTANHPPPTRARYICTACGRVHDSWAARCSGCATWDLQLVDPKVPYAGIELPKPEPEPPRLSIVTATEPATAPPGHVETTPPRTLPPRLADVRAETFVRLATGIEPLDAVLGGGFVVGASVLIAAPRGIGKSTLVLQAIAGLNLPALYVSAEEPVSFIGERARRCRLDIDQIYVNEERMIETIFEAALAADVRVVVIDSIQKMRCAELDSREGTPGQIKLCAERILQFGHDNKITMITIGQMTAEDKVAGGKALEHEVDVILELEAVGKHAQVIKLRCPGKNRTGATNVIGKFKMSSNGLVPFKSGEPGVGEVDASDEDDDEDDEDEPNVH